VVSEPLRYARDYIAKGLSIIPIGRGTKEPAYHLLPLVYDETSGKDRHSWGMYQERYPEPEELVAWFVGAENGIAIVCGKVSGGLVVLDIESVELYERWRELAEALLDPSLLDQLPIVATGKGRHVYFRMPEPVGNLRLAMDGKTLLAETRGQGGCAVVPPTVHPSGATYTLINGDLGAIPLLDAAQAQALLDAARALAPLQEHPASKPTDTTGKTASTGPGNDVIGAFNRAHSIEGILEAHGYVRTRSGSYIRPGGGHGSVIIVSGKSIHFNPADDLYSEAPDGGYHAQTPFSAFCILDHGGDVRAAVRAAARELGLSHQMRQEPGSSPRRQDSVLAEAGRVLGLEDQSDSWPYFEDHGGIWMYQRERNGSQASLPLCNFLARIVAETVVDDGEHQEEWYTLRATCQGRTREIELRRTEFESDTALSRIVAALGARARVNPRTQPKYVLDAIKAFSADVAERVVHTHTGWVDGRYLFANGYVDGEGWHEASGCQLPRRLQAYGLSPGRGTIEDGLARLDDLLALAPAKVMVPLLGGVLLGPIGATIDAPAPMVHINGPTGCHKTSICCAAMGLAGAFLPAQPTDSWTSTANSIQRLGWHLKDAPMLLDDYKAAHVKAQHVTFLLQNYGDNMARGRLDANSDVRSTFPMRCVLISSGEDQPEGEASTLARILSVPLARCEVNRERLTAIQQGAEGLHALTVDYLRWLAAGADQGGNNQRHQAIRAAILSQLEESLDNATNPGRIASNVAVLYVAWEVFTRFLAERGHWATERAADWLLTCNRELLGLARGQLNLTVQERYSQLFLETLRGLVVSGRALIYNIESGVPELRSNQVLLGARDYQGTYVIAQASYDEVCRHLRAAGRLVTFTQRALSQLFEQDGLLQSTSPPSLLVKRRINGVRCWCWHLPAEVLGE
jgi:hypothetical protein